MILLPVVNTIKVTFPYIVIVKSEIFVILVGDFFIEDCHQHVEIGLHGVQLKLQSVYNSQKGESHMVPDLD